MKYIVLSLLGLFLGCSLQAQTLANSKDSISYAVGLELAKKLDSDGFTDVNLDKVKMALEDVLSKREPVINTYDAAILYAEELRNNKEKINESNIEAGANFIAEKAKQPNVKALSNGIYYEVLKEGNGPKPEAGGDVTIHYEGKLIDGTVFDSSYERGKPNTFNLKRLIKGWQVALPEMPVGSKWRIYIPYDMAYGERGAGGKIKPYSALIFDIELFGI